jgi:hypothetical protein
MATIVAQPAGLRHNCGQDNRRSPRLRRADVSTPTGFSSPLVQVVMPCRAASLTRLPPGGPE